MKKLLGFLILIGVGLVGTAYWLNHSSRTTGEGPFTTVPVERGAIAETINATGILQPRSVTAVGSALSGEVVKVFPEADFNKHVTKGQPLLQLDDRVAKLKRDQAQIAVQLAGADVERAQSAVAAAEAGLTRVQKAFAKDLAKQEDLNQAKYTFQSAQAAQKAAEIKVEEAKEGLRAAELGLDLTTIRAPATGIIIDKQVVSGQLVAPPASAKLFVIANDNLERMRLFTQVAEGDVSRVTPGLKATFTIYAYTDVNDAFEGTVEEIRPMSTNVQGAVFYTVVIGATNRRVPSAGTRGEGRGARGDGEWMLRPGMTGTVDIQRRRHENAVKMPNAALNFQLDEHYQTPEAKAKIREWDGRKDRNQWKYVWVVRDKKPWPVFIRTGGTNAQGETGIKDGQYTEVLQWDPDEPKVDLGAGAALPEVIIAAPPVTKPGLFNQAPIKFS